MSSNNINDMVKQLVGWRESYYNGTPDVPDSVFDARENQLRALDPHNAYFGQVGAAPTDGKWPKVKHSTPMGSLDKAQEPADIIAWYKSVTESTLWPSTPTLILSDKLDGLSVNLCYKDRNFVQGLTRGNGALGEDITRNVLLMQGLIKRLPALMPDGTPTPDLVFVRGEIVLLHSDFKAGFPVEYADWKAKGSSNPRNSASGTAKRQSDPFKCRYLTIKCYQFLPNGMATLPSKKAEFKALEAAGFRTPNWYMCPSLAEVEGYYKGYIDEVRELLDYDIDGQVIEIDCTQNREFYGEHNGKPNGAIAYKFPHEEAPSILQNVRWQVGKSGRITPVAEFDTVSLAGARISQASLHNISNMMTLVSNLCGDSGFPRKGDEILVARRNDVIPYVEGIVTRNNTTPAINFVPPKVCPECGTPLERDGEYLVCRGEECPAQIAGSFRRWVQKIGVLHCGAAFIEALIAAGMIEDIADLYLLDPTEAEDIEIGGRRAGGTATKAIKNLEARKNLSLHVFVGALGIPLIGRSMAKTIVDGGVNSLSKMAKVTSAELATIPGVGATKAKSFVQGFNERLPLIGRLISEAGITIQTISGPLVGKSFCFTGFRSPELEDAIEKAGGTMKSSVSKDLTYLVAFDTSSNSGKMSKAKSIGSTVISQEDAWKLTVQTP